MTVAARSAARTDRAGSGGLFIAFEGGDGSGKSTQTRLLADHLEASGRRVLLTREPGGTPLAERLRSLVLDPEHAPVDPVTEALLFAAARSSHVRRAVLPALEKGTVVVTDRYTDSSVAYQGAGRNLGIERIAALNAWATDGLAPDLTVLLDVDAETARARRTARQRLQDGGGPDRLESELDAHHARIRQAFRDRAAADDGARYLVLDAAGDQDDLAARIAGRVLALLGDGKSAGRPTGPDHEAGR